jgi:hypothetical protein
MLRQIPGWGQVVGISLVTIAAIGAARTGRAAEPVAEVAVPAPG